MSALDLSQKLPMARSLNQIAEKKAHDLIQIQGKALPASVVSVSGSIVTVKFEIQTAYNATLTNVTVPVAGPEYIRYPIQAGDKGMVIPSSAYLGGVSGLGGGTANLAMPANLSALVFLPIGNKNFSATDNPNSTVIYGPDGAILRNVSKNAGVYVTDNQVQIKAGGQTWTFTSAGLVSSLNNITLEEHVHPANNQPPTPGT